MIGSGRIGRVDRPGARGFTLLELVIASVIGLSMLVGSLTLLRSAFGGINSNEDASRLQERIVQIADRLDREVRTAGRDTLQGPGATGLEPLAQGQPYPELHFRTTTGFEGFTTPGPANNPTYGPVKTLRRDLDPGETQNGLDDDGDGLVDEGGLLLEVVGSPTTLVASDVTDFRVVRNGNTLTLTVEARLWDRVEGEYRRRVVREVTLPNP